MNEPRRLSKSGGVAQRLLDSASLDTPSQASRRHAVNLAATASAIASTRSGPSAAPPRRIHPARTLATWALVGAAASGTLGLIGGKLLEPNSAPRTAAPLLTPADPAPPAASPDISPEPAAPTNTVPTLAPAPSGSVDEASKLEAARTAISRGDHAAAVAALDDYDLSYPKGELKPEAMVLRIQALSESGRLTEARALASEFQGKYPAHPLVRQVRGGVPK